MIREIARIAASGVITIYKIDSNKNKILTSKNAVIPNAMSLISQIMAGNTAATITRVELFNDAAQVYAAPITTKDFTEDTVTFTALISETDFTGTINNAKLGPTDSATLGFFSLVSFSPVVKTNTEQLLIEWEITFTEIN